MYRNYDPRSGHEKSFHPYIIVSWLLILPLDNSVYFTAKSGIKLMMFIYLFTDMSIECRSILSTDTTEGCTNYTRSKFFNLG